MSSKNFLRLSTSLALSISGVFLVNIFIDDRANIWFDSLIKPNSFSQKYLFVLVSALLAISVGLALYLAWKNIAGSDRQMKILVIFLLPLVFNIFWSFIFFQLQNIYLAFLSLILVIIFTLAMIVKFYAIERKTVYFLAPYLLWILFISFLNYKLWLLN